MTRWLSEICRAFGISGCNMSCVEAAAELETVLKSYLGWLSALLLPLACAVALPLNAQDEWDRYDVVDGDNPTLRYGFYVNDDEQIELGRYYFFDDGNNLRIRLAPYGQSPTEFIVSRFDRVKGELELRWGENSERTCAHSPGTRTRFFWTLARRARA